MLANISWELNKWCFWINKIVRDNHEGFLVFWRSCTSVLKVVNDESILALGFLYYGLLFGCFEFGIFLCWVWIFIILYCSKVSYKLIKLLCLEHHLCFLSNFKSKFETKKRHWKAYLKFEGDQFHWLGAQCKPSCESLAQWHPKNFPRAPK